MPTGNRLVGRIRAYGRARVDITLNARDEADWQRRWHEPLNDFPFELGQAAFEYAVEDFPAEVGFFIDILGFSTTAFSPSFAQFSSPDGNFRFAVSACQPDQSGTSPDTLRIQFVIQDFNQTIQELESRGVVFDPSPEAVQRSPVSNHARFRTPHGITIDLISEGEEPPESSAEGEYAQAEDDYQTLDAPEAGLEAGEYDSQIQLVMTSDHADAEALPDNQPEAHSSNQPNLPRQNPPALNDFSVSARRNDHRHPPRSNPWSSAIETKPERSHLKVGRSTAIQHLPDRESSSPGSQLEKDQSAKHEVEITYSDLDEYDSEG